MLKKHNLELISASLVNNAGLSGYFIFIHFTTRTYYVSTACAFPIEAAYIAANVYFTLEGWEATYQFRAIHGSNVKGEPKPKPGMASQDVIKIM